MGNKEHRYVVLPQNEGFAHHESEIAQKRTSKVVWVLSLIILALLCSNAILAISLYGNSSSSGSINVSSYTGLDRSRINLMEGYRRQEYQSMNETLADSYWDAVNLGHGIVALDVDYALNELHLPQSRPWKPDVSKAIYAIAAYHAMHCIPYLRRLIKESHGGQQIVDEPYHHALHCLNILREEVMCTADDALLTMPMADESRRHPVGYQQERKCYDWAPLRDWATEHSAGYLTYEDHPGVWHWGVNYPPTDGWLVD